MTERTTPWPAGTPCWLDLMTPDIDATRLFYEELFGWHFASGGEDAGGYLIAEIDGKPVAGVGPQQPEQGGFPAVWTTYVATEDAAATAAKITEAGGNVFMPPFDVLDIGVMGLAMDPTGAVFGLWQPKTFGGVQLANVANAWNWDEVMSRDFAGAKQFYADVFGWTYTDMSGGGFEYATFEVNGNTAGGIGGLPAEVPEEVSAHWRMYFAVDDADEAVDMVVKLGGSVFSPPQDMPYGRHADVADPTGARFSVIKPATPE